VSASCQLRLGCGPGRLSHGGKAKGSTASVPMEMQPRIDLAAIEPVQRIVQRIGVDPVAGNHKRAGNGLPPSVLLAGIQDASLILGCGGHDLSLGHFQMRAAQQQCHCGRVELIQQSYSSPIIRPDSPSPESQTHTSETAGQRPSPGERLRFGRRVRPSPAGVV
jgi:hypothetical protein